MRCSIGLPISISSKNSIFLAASLNHSVLSFLSMTTAASGIELLNSLNLFSKALNLSEIDNKSS